VNGNGNIIGRQSIENEGGNDNKLQSIVHGNGNGTGNVELLQSIVNGDEKNMRTKSKQKNKKSLRRLGPGLFFPAFLDGEGSGAAGRSLRGVNCVTLR
jgi:hypothetical protein